MLTSTLRQSGSGLHKRALITLTCFLELFPRRANSEKTLQVDHFALTDGSSENNAKMSQNGPF